MGYLDGFLEWTLTEITGGTNANPDLQARICNKNGVFMLIGREDIVPLYDDVERTACDSQINHALKLLATKTLRDFCDAVLAPDTHKFLHAEVLGHGLYRLSLQNPGREFNHSARGYVLNEEELETMWEDHIDLVKNDHPDAARTYDQNGLMLQILICGQAADQDLSPYYHYKIPMHP